MGINKNNQYLFIGILIAIFVLTYFPYFSSDKNPMTDPYSLYYPYTEVLDQSIEQNDFFPLWNPYKLGGRPYIGTLGPKLLSPLGIYLTLGGNAINAIRIWELASVLIAGLAMFFLIQYLFNKPILSFLGALIYMHTGYLLRYLNDGNLHTLSGYAFLPFMFYFLFKTFKEKNIVKYSVIFGLVLGLFFWISPDFKVFPFFMIFVGIYSLVYLLTDLKKSTFKKIITFYIIMGIVFAGISMKEVLPLKEGVENSWREESSYEQVQNSRRIKPNQIFSKLIQPTKEFGFKSPLYPTAHLGIVAFLLAIYAIVKKYKNKNVLSLSLGAIASILIAMGTPLLYILWKFVPGFQSFRFIERALVLYVICGTILAVYGAKELIEKFKGKEKIITYSLIALILLNLNLFNFLPYPTGEWISDLDQVRRDNELLQYVSEQEGYFRFHDLETRGIEFTTEPYTVPYKIEQIYGYGSFWTVDYFNVFLGTATRAPTKFWGIMNTKYISSREKVNVSSLELIKTFDACTKNCAPVGYVKIHGEYLYKNKDFLPRAYTTNRAALILGSEDFKTQMTYSIMVLPEFDPKEFILMWAEDKEYSLSELNQFNWIIAEPGQSTSGYTGNLMIGEDISVGSIMGMLDSDESSYEPVKDSNILKSDFDHMSISTNSNNKWLVVSEKFSLFNGWNANAPLYRVNGVVTAFPVQKEINLEFKPKSFRTARILFWITISIVIIYFVVERRK